MERVSDFMRFSNQRRTITRAKIMQQRTQERLSTGRRITRASDDPSGTSAALRLRASLSRSDAFLATLKQVRRVTDTAEVAIAQTELGLERAAQLGVQGANGTLTASDRTALAVEVQGIISSTIALSNTEVDGRHVFAGTKTTDPPFVADTDPPQTVTYQGDQVQSPVLVSPGVEVQMSVPGNRLAAAGGGLFEGLVALRDALENKAGLSDADQAAAVQAATGKVQLAHKDVGYLRSQIGVQQKRVEDAQSLIEVVQQRTQEARTRLEDVDVAQAATEFVTANRNLQATLAAAGRTLKVSLLDFLT